MKKNFNIHVFRTNEEFSVFLDVADPDLPKEYDDEDVISLAVELGKLSEEDSEIVAYIEEISAEEYRQETRGLMSWQRTI